MRYLIFLAEHTESRNEFSKIDDVSYRRHEAVSELVPLLSAVQQVRCRVQWACLQRSTIQEGRHT